MVSNINATLPARLSSKLPVSMMALQYADDTAFIISADVTTVVSFKILLRLFTKMSGLSINFAKSSIVPINLDQHAVQLIKAITGCSSTNFPVMYLGMPLTIKQPPKQAFMPLLDKLQLRLQGWQTKLISRGGRLQLVQSVMSAIPIYYMSCFKLPCWVINRIDKIRRDFLGPHQWVQW